MATPTGVLKVLVPTVLAGGLFVGGGIWLGIRNERRMMESARAAAESRLAALPALREQMASLPAAAPEPGGEAPLAFATPPTRSNAIAIHEEDLANLAAPAPVAFRWCSDTATTAACLARKEEWAPGQPLKWQEKQDAARRMQDFAAFRFVLVVRNGDCEPPSYEEHSQFKGGRLTAEVFVFDLDAKPAFLGRFPIEASLGSTVTGLDLSGALRQRCREALWEALRERAPGADCDAGRD